MLAEPLHGWYNRSLVRQREQRRDPGRRRTERIGIFAPARISARERNHARHIAHWHAAYAHVQEHERAFVQILQRAGIEDHGSYVEPARWLQLIDYQETEHKHQPACKPRTVSDMVDALVCYCDAFIHFMDSLSALGEPPRLPRADKDGVEQYEAVAFDFAHLGFSVGGRAACHVPSGHVLPTEPRSSERQACKRGAACRNCSSHDGRIRTCDCKRS